MKPRKSMKQSRTSLELLRDAMPTARELEGRPNTLELRDAQREGRHLDDTPNATKAREAKLRQNLAIHELSATYLEYKTAGRLNQLDISVRLFIEARIRANGGKLPRPRIGRPRDPHHDFRRVLIYLKIREEICARRPAPGQLTATLKSIASNLNITSDQTGGKAILRVSYAEMREIYYDRSKDFLELVGAIMGLRELLKPSGTQT